MALQAADPQPSSPAGRKNSQYESTIIDFVQKDQGCFIVVSDDQAFAGALRSVLHKQLALTASSVLTIVADHSQILKVLKDADNGKRTPHVFMERILDGQDMTFMVKQLKTAFPRLLIIVLTVDVERHRIMYLHEMGADNFIAKPVSLQTIIEKLAFTIKPQTQLGVLIDSAREFLEDGRPERARLTALEILDMKPGSAAGLMVLGDAELALGNSDAAKQAYQEASDNAALYMEPLRKLAALAGLCAERVVAPEDTDCCGFAGDRGFTHPELNESALHSLRFQVNDCDAGYSTSRTCQIGLSLHSGIPYYSILNLVDEATRAKG